MVVTRCHEHRIANKLVGEESKMATYKQLKNEYDTTRGLWCIDRNPAEVDYDWIKRNAFQLEDYLTSDDDEAGKSGITIGAFLLREAKNREKVWLTGPSGQNTEIDAKVLEDILKSFF
jgi:hypothetical protein